MSHIEQLVARQIEWWELRQRLEQEYRLEHKEKQEPTAYGPCLLVSREQDSGGTRIAQLVGERLGWRIFGREIVEEIARHAHLRRQLVETVDEHVRSRWSEWFHLRHSPEHLTAHDYLVHLREVILSLGHHGYVVIIGRGSQFILPHSGSLRVRFVERADLRAHRRSIGGRSSLEEARREIEGIDAERRAFVRRLFAADPDDPHHYDLLLNTGDLSQEAAVDIVLLAMREKLGVHPEAAPCIT